MYVLLLCVGILVTVFVFIIFWTYSDTPVVKASGRELSYLLLVGILASFCVTFVIVAHPTSFTCGLTRFFLGFCYTLCYAAIVTKTNRIARIFSNRPISPHKTRYFLTFIPQTSFSDLVIIIYRLGCFAWCSLRINSLRFHFQMLL